MDIELIVDSREHDIDNPRALFRRYKHVIYTSERLVNLKGTLVPHRGIDRLVHNQIMSELNENTTVLLSGTVAFDAATFEIYGPLLNGGRLSLHLKIRC